MTLLGRCTLLLPLLLALASCGRIEFGDLPADAPREASSVLRLDRVAPAETLANFPLPIVLDGSRADLGILTAESLRAFQGDTELAVEVESAGPPLVAWIRVAAVVGTSTEITIRYGGVPQAPQLVWDADYLGVWHMNASAIDSSGSARAGTATSVGFVPGVVGGAASYTRAQSSCTVVPSFSGLAFQAATLSAWLRFRTAGNNPFQLVLTRQIDDMAVDDFLLGTDPTDRPIGGVAAMGGGIPSLVGAMSVPPQVWHQITYSFDGATFATLYVDGVAISGGNAAGTPQVSARPLFIGCGRNTNGGTVETPDGDWVDGEIDEIRVEAVGRSAAWIDYTVRAHRDEVVTYGPVEL